MTEKTPKDFDVFFEPVRTVMTKSRELRTNSKESFHFLGVNEERSSELIEDQMHRSIRVFLAEVEHDGVTKLCPHLGGAHTTQRCIEWVVDPSPDFGERKYTLEEWAQIFHAQAVQDELITEKERLRKIYRDLSFRAAKGEF